MFNTVVKTVKNNKIKFVFLWFIIFLMSFVLLSALGLVPNVDENKETISNPTQGSLEQKLASIPSSLPSRIVIDEIRVDVVINNPQSRSIDVLDRSLNTGAVRYPSSGLLGDKTNMLLFGHSSFLPIVRNRNFKAFNNLEDLREGSRISIYSETHKFIYEVTSVEEADAENALVVFDSEKRELTLSTCNSFGDLNDRFVVRANLVDVLEK